MALEAYMRIAGETQGEILGPVTQVGREGSIRVIGFSHELKSHCDGASGLPNGKCRHSAITITKAIDKTSPQLMSMLVNNENVKDLELRFWQPNDSGREVQFYTIQLTNASVAGIRQEMLDSETGPRRGCEHVSICYRQITWTFEDGGICSDAKW